MRGQAAAGDWEVTGSPECVIRCVRHELSAFVFEFVLLSLSHKLAASPLRVANAYHLGRLRRARLKPIAIQQQDRSHHTAERETDMGLWRALAQPHCSLLIWPASRVQAVRVVSPQ